MDFPPICGFNECSEMGNDVFAPSIFLGGCNLQCPYCMNSKLILTQSPRVDLEEVRKYIRNNNSEWVMISGGEPTCIRPELLQNLLNFFKGLGCKIGMSTNGTNPENLDRALGLLNYVALDIKSNNDKIYNSLSNDSGSYGFLMNVLRSQALMAEIKLGRDDFDYEIRTTLYPPYIDETSLRDIGTVIRKDDKWVLQQFRHAKNMFSQDAYNVEPYSEKKVQVFLKIAQRITSKAELRYV